MKLRFYVNNNKEFIEYKEDFELNQLVNDTSNTIYYKIQDMAITTIKEL